MIKFYLYTNEDDKPKVISQVIDEMTAHFLKSYYKQIYDKNCFLVTMKRPRKKEIYVCGNHELLK